MKAENVKIGMKVKIASNPPKHCYGHGEVGGILTITGLPNVMHHCGADGFKGQHGGKSGFINCAFIEPYVFTKADLKTGMRVVYRDKTTRVVVGKTFSSKTGYNSVNDFASNYSNDLLNNYYADLDIMEVYAAPASCEDFFNLDVRGELLFKRDESPKKTEKQKQKQAEELRAKAAKLKEEFEALVKQATDLAGE